MYFYFIIFDLLFHLAYVFFLCKSSKKFVHLFHAIYVNSFYSKGAYIYSQSEKFKLYKYAFTSGALINIH